MNRIQERGFGYEIANSLTGCFISLTLLIGRIKDLFHQCFSCCGNPYAAIDSDSE